jgi:type II secretory pathway pseudopilin PulG
VLVELLIVLVVLGLLAAIAIPRFSAAKDHANDVAAMNDVRNAIHMVQGYESVHAQYPANMEAVGFEPSSGIEFTRWNLGTANGETYLLLEAGHANSDWRFYSFYPVQTEIKKRDRDGDEPKIDGLPPSESVAK